MITQSMVSTTLKAIKSGKASGSSSRVVEIFRVDVSNNEERIVALAIAIVQESIFHMTGTIHTLTSAKENVML